MDSNFIGQGAGDRTPKTSLETEFYQRLQQSPLLNEAQKPLPQKWFKHWATELLNYLTGTQTLSIRQKLCANGSAQWIAYDPNTNTRHVFSSEQAVRIWLEQRR